MTTPPRRTGAPFLLDEAGAQFIFAPFFHSDSKVSDHLPIRLEPLAGAGCRLERQWATTQVRWDYCDPEATACRLTWDRAEDATGYDELILCLDTGRNVTVRVLVDADGLDPNRFELETHGKRGELVVPLSTDQIRSIQLEAVPHTTDPGHILLLWFGLGNRALAQQRRERPYTFDPAWPGLVHPSPDWDRPAFARGLLFDADLLPRLRARKRRPGWDRVFALLEAQAEALLGRCPEEEIERFIPWSDGRFMREDQVRSDLFYSGPLTLALVGLVNQDARMLDLAVRFLMAFLHTPHWCAAENRISGSTWDGKCFQEEMAVTHVALLGDWLDVALTRHGKELVRKCIWDKGLSYVERDLMKYAYMWDINQGPWFCRARILGGLMLENKWPRMGDYVDRAYREMLEMMDRYILPDGGTDEGLSYFGITMHAVLEGIFAYARARDRDPLDLMPKHMDQVENFIATLSGLAPGTILTEGDASTSRIPGDAMAMLAGLLPDSLYGKVFAGTMEKDAAGCYMKQYLQFFELGFALGPEEFTPATCVVPTFSRLPDTGHLTSCRHHDGHAVRLHLTGAKAMASHTHLDKGGIILEIDGHSVLVDRGVVRYDDDRSVTMNRTCLHNAITPIRADGSFPDQGRVLEAQIPDGQGDETRLEATINISHCWREEMSRCARHVESEHPFHLAIRDEGELRTPGPVAFHLQSLRPFVIREGGVHLPFEGGDLIIEAPWAVRIEQAVDGIDLHDRDVHHAWWISPEMSAFALETRIRVRMQSSS